MKTTKKMRLTHYWDVTFLTQIVPSYYFTVTYINVKFFFRQRLNKSHEAQSEDGFAKATDYMMVGWKFNYRFIPWKLWAQFVVLVVPTWGNVLAPHGHAACPFHDVFVLHANVWRDDVPMMLFR